MKERKREKSDGVKPCATRSGGDDAKGERAADGNARNARAPPANYASPTAAGRAAPANANTVRILK